MTSPAREGSTDTLNGYANVGAAGCNAEVTYLAGALQGMQAAWVESGTLGTELEKDQPFVKAVESLVELNRQLTSEREIRLSVRAGFPPPPELPGTADVELLRVLQEALINARRHSDARRVEVILSADTREVRAEVTDEGHGFDPATVREGVGLAGMRERAGALGGSLRIKSAPGGGTSVRVEIPFSGSPAQRIPRGVSSGAPAPRCLRDRSGSRR